ncbi:MAG TPA: superoxide dismutase family protein [Thermoanaerobaculia bacterium]|nr:superoxide dismutase family protein [Thermoanaerobaculia bacterium]
MKKLVYSILVLAIALVGLAGCASSKGPSATVTLTPTSGNTAQGAVTFRQLKTGQVEVEVNLTGVPSGTHGFHLHEKGDCGDNGNAAGGHFNPSSMAHGAPDATSHHAGDFGNVTADDSGNVRVTRTVNGITVTAGPNSVVGHAVILHANADDLVTQPSGNAGPRIACGVVLGTP